MRRIEQALLAVLFVVPAFSILRFWPINSALPNGLALTIGALLFSVRLAATARNQELPFSSVVALPVLVAIPLLVSWFNVSPEIMVSFRWALVTLLLGVAVMMSGLSLGVCWGRDYLVTFLSWALLVAGTIYAALSLLLYYGVIGAAFGVLFPDTGRLGGSWGQPNLTTSTLWLALFAAVYLACRHAHGLRWLFAFSILIGWVMALAASRLNYLFIPLSLGLAVFAITREQAPIIRQGKALAGVALVLSLCLLIVPPASQPLEVQLADMGWIEASSDISLAERETLSQPRLIEHAKIFRSLPNRSLEEWLVGSGFGQYGVFSFEQPVTPYGSAGGQGAWTHSHNLFSMIFIEMGLIGLLVVVGIVLTLVYRLWRSRLEVWFMPVAGVMGTLFLHSMVEYPLWYPWYLMVGLLFALPLFKLSLIPVMSGRLLYAAATLFLIVTLGSVWNLGSQVVAIGSIAAKEDPGKDSYREMTLLANDSFLGPYAILAKYRRFPPEDLNLEWQLEEARRMANWRPLDVVKVREATLLMMLGNVDEACHAIEETAAHYPASAPILIEKAVRIEGINMPEIARFGDCAESGLKVWGEDLASMEEKNLRRIESIRVN